MLAVFETGPQITPLAPYSTTCGAEFAWRYGLTILGNGTRRAAVAPNWPANESL